MDECELSDAIACSLAWVYPFHRDPSFLDYLSLTYSESLAELPVFEMLCLAEAEYGDAKTGVIGGIIKRWWLTDQEGCRSVPYRDLPPFTTEFNAAEGTDQVFYRFPLIKFLREDMSVTFGEAYGPRLACRKVGRVQQLDGSISIVDVRLIWNVKSLGRDLSMPLISPEFDIVGRRVGRTRRWT